MKKIILIIIGTALLTTIAIIVILERKAQKDQLQCSSIEIIESEILGESRKLLVHLPKDYNQQDNAKYPVIYALDATSHDKDLLYAASMLSSAHHIENLIVVGIVNKDRNTDLTPNYIQKNDNPNKFGEGKHFLQFIEQEVIKRIESKYKTSGYRIISGNSRAGLFSFYSLLEKPDLFDAHFCFSPAFWRSDNIIAAKTSEFLEKEKQIQNFVYLSIGENENDKMSTAFDSVIDTLKKKDTIVPNLHYERTKNTDHGTNAYYSIPRALTEWNKKR